MLQTLRSWQGNVFSVSGRLHCWVVATASCNKVLFFGENALSCLHCLCWLVASCSGVPARPTVNDTWLLPRNCHPSCGRDDMAALCKPPALSRTEALQFHASVAIKESPCSFSLSASPHSQHPPWNKAFPYMFLLRPKLPSEEDVLQFCPYLSLLHYI